MDEHHLIGRAGGLPWHLPADLRRFRKLTMGHPILMGRRTYESLGRLLPGRRSIVITRQRGYNGSGALIAHSLRQAFSMVRNSEVAFVIGGADLYRQALPFVRCMEVTHVAGVFDGDSYFPQVDWAEWTVMAESRFEPDARNPHAYRFVRYARNRMDAPESCPEEADSGAPGPPG